MNIMEANNITPVMTTRPTEIIKDEIKARGMSKKEFAERMQMQQSNVSRLLKGEDISVSMANKLEQALDISADFWLRLQTDYDKDKMALERREESEKSACNTERLLSAFLDLKLLYKRLGIKTELFVNEKLRILQSLLKFDPIDLGTKKLVAQFSFKKSDKLDIDDINQNTWLTLAYIKSVNSDLQIPFIKNNALKAAHELSGLSRSENITEADMKSCLNRYGIIYEVEENLPKVPIDAVAINIGDRPAIIVTHRYDDMAMLIFNVMHELGHIELHMGNNLDEMFISSDSKYSSTDIKEKQANTFAEDMLIDKVTWNRIMSTKINTLWGYEIVSVLRKLAKENGLNEHIVIWRYKHDSRKYNLKSVPKYRIAKN
jgi:HTH-type transcriptional regulator/antitoxin HigA